MSQQLYVTLEWTFPRGRKQVIGPLANLKNIRVTELTTEEGQAPGLAEIVVWSRPEAKPAAAKKTASKVTATKRAKRTMSAATRAKISQTQRKRHAAKATRSTASD